MKKILLATSILAATTGLAAAEVTLSGDARMGIIDGFGLAETAFTSRARVKFTLSGETDGGLAFGAEFRANDAGDATSGRAGKVFISGAFGKLSVGDIDGAAEQAVGNVDGVGLTGLSDLNEAIYVQDFVDEFSTEIDPTAAYEYSTGGFTGIISVSNPGADEDVWSVGVRYSGGAYAVALGYEDDGFNRHVILGASATLGAVTLKGDFGRVSEPGLDRDQYHLSATYTADALGVTAFWGDETVFGSLGNAESYGIGATYDLGGGARLAGGYAVTDFGGPVNDDAFDLGIAFDF